MARFTEDVKVLNRISDRVHDWELCEVVRYYLVDPDGEAVHVPPGFVTDLASVPRPFWFWIAPCSGAARRSSLVPSSGPRARPARRRWPTA
jgi:hypothetical protein